MIQTPFYLIDKAKLLRNMKVIDRLRAGSGAKALLALKCFATWSAFDLMRDHMDGTTSSSLYELRLGREKFGKETHAYSVAWADHEIAEAVGLHESTISRVTTAKYMATPFGTFELKYFFGSGLGTESGGNASSTAVRALIKQFVAAESPKKPLSDNQISDMLKEQGIECARRTVAKYREGLRIAPASLRKAL